MTRAEIAEAFVNLYEAIDGPSDELSMREHRVVQEYWPTYVAIKEEVRK